jgi:formate/nitrite transporter FocA (FNT family)
VAITPVPPQDILDQQPEDIAARAETVGEERLGRSNRDIFITGGVAGVEVSLGGLAAMTVVGAALESIPGLPLYGALALGALAFPIGFLFVILGRSELFTENFLIPVLALLNRERSPRSLAELWALSWLGNMLACLGMAVLLSQSGAVGEPILNGYRAYAEYKLALPLQAVFLSAVLAGMVMTVLTWLMLAMRDAVAKILCIFAAGYLLFAANLSHSMVGAAVLFVGYHLADRTPGEVLGWIVVATLGNLVGGVAFVTVLRLAQVTERRRADK